MNLYRQVLDTDNCSLSSGSSESGLLTVRSDSVLSLNSAHRYPALRYELEHIRWYHLNMNRNAAQHILEGTNRVGSYLLRNYSKGGPDDLTVSVKYPDGVKHFPIIWEGDGYTFGMHKFDNLKKLLLHFENIPAIGTSDATQAEGSVQVELRYPYPREVSNDKFASYGEITEHLESGARPVDIHSPDAHEHSGDPQFEIRQKSGYLTKRGDRVKSWKNRWFVIHKHWMRYYVSRESSSPRGVIDLSQAIDVREDDSFCNGFALIIPKRVYYIQAANPAERRSWIEMITWKLDYYNAYREKDEKWKPLRIRS